MMKAFNISLLVWMGMLMAGCAQQDARSVLDAAQRTIGDAQTISEISRIYARADCSGPNGPFQTQIWSAREGFVRFEQRSSRDTTIAGINDARAWSLQDTAVVDIDLPSEVFFQGHELHLIALDPLSRFKDPVYAGRSSFNEKEAIRIRFRDRLDNPVDVYYDASKNYPLGMEIENPFDAEAEGIRILFQDWKQLDNGLFFFTSASFLQGGAVWSYAYRRIEVNTFDDAVFDPSLL